MLLACWVLGVIKLTNTFAKKKHDNKNGLFWYDPFFVYVLPVLFEKFDKFNAVFVRNRHELFSLRLV